MKSIVMGLNSSIHMLGVRFDDLTLSGSLDKIREFLAKKTPHIIVTPNVDFLMLARAMPSFRKILEKTDLNLCDSMPLFWVSRFYGKPLSARIAGSDLFPLLCAEAATQGWKVYLFGAMPGIAQKAKEKLETQFPSLCVVGAVSPSENFAVDSPDAITIVENINSTSPDILFVALGTPKQEEFLFKYKERLRTPVNIGVGGSFDFFVGSKKRASIWVQNMGLEWAYRLIHEPKRLWWRYLMRDSFCPILIGIEILKKKWFLRTKGIAGDEC